MVTKQGQLKAKGFSEFLVSLYDRDIYVEPDGSAWARVSHQNNPASTANLLPSSTTYTTTPTYKNDNAWIQAPIFNEMSTWEFMVKQKTTATATENKYRWVQTKNPNTAVFADVASANITKNTTTGYTTFGHGGIYKMGGSTYFCTNNGTSGNWWGAVGSVSQHQSGIPGWAGAVVTTGYLDLYVRVDNVKLTPSITSTDFLFNSFIEM